MGPDAMILVFWMLSFKSTFSLSFTFKQTVMLNKTISPAQTSLSSRPVFPTTCQISGEGTGDPLQCSCLETSMDGGAWWAAVHGIAELDMTRWLHFRFSLSCIGEGNGNPLQCSCLENPRDGEAWWTAVYWVTQIWTWLMWLSSSQISPFDCLGLSSVCLESSEWHLPSLCLHPTLWVLLEKNMLLGRLVPRQING